MFISIEEKVKDEDKNYYHKNHKKFLFEIEAKLYGILKAEEKLILLPCLPVYFPVNYKCYSFQLASTGNTSLTA